MPSVIAEDKMGHLWNDTDRSKQNYLEKALSQCHFVHHKSHMFAPGLCCERQAGTTGRPVPTFRLFMPYALTTTHPSLVYGTAINQAPQTPWFFISVFSI